MLLSDEEVWGLATKCDMALAPASAIWAIREAVRIAAERCAQICEERGNAVAEKWAALDENAELAEYAKARAWDCLQCAAAIRGRVKAPGQ